MCQLCPCELHWVAVGSITPEISQDSWRAVIPFSKRNYSTFSSSPWKFTRNFAYSRLDYWKFYRSSSNNVVFFSCSLQKNRRRSSGLDGQQSWLSQILEINKNCWPPLSKESTEKCAEIKCFTNTEFKPQVWKNQSHEIMQLNQHPLLRSHLWVRGVKSRRARVTLPYSHLVFTMLYTRAGLAVAFPCISMWPPGLFPSP